MENENEDTMFGCVVPPDYGAFFSSCLMQETWIYGLLIKILNFEDIYGFSVHYKDKDLPKNEGLLLCELKS